MSIKYNDKTNNREILLAGVSPVDTLLSPTSKNAIANKTVYNALLEKVEKTVTDLINYYTKTDTYNKAEVRELIGAINTLTIEVVSSLPSSDISTTTIYFLKQASPSTSYDEYVYVNNAWVKIGDTNIDLSQYVTSSALTTALQDYYNKAAVDNLLTSYYTKTEMDTTMADYYDKDAVDALLDDKQDKLTFDTTPTANSNNPVTSGGIKNAIDAIPSNPVDAITDGDMHAVTSNAVYDALNYQYGTLDTTAKVSSGEASWRLFGRIMVVTFAMMPAASATSWAIVANKTGLNLPGSGSALGAFHVYKNNSGEAGMAQVQVTKNSIELKFATYASNYVGASCRGEVVIILA